MPADAPLGCVSVTLHGGRTATVTRPEKGWPDHIQLEILGPPAPPFREVKWPVGASAARKRLARDANLTEVEVIQIEEAAINFVNAAQAAAARPVSLNDPFDVTAHSQVTGNEQTFAVNGITEFLKLLQQAQSPSVFLRWTSDDVIILDCDFHQENRPGPGVIHRLMNELAPTPYAKHTTTRGFHAVYGRVGGMKATELAAAASAFLRMHPLLHAYHGEVELLHRTRHPCSDHNGKMYGPLLLQLPDDVTPILYTLDEAGVSEDERGEALAHYAWQLGERLPHDRCPIDPGHTSKSPAPVCIMDSGVFCYSCAARGAGFLSWNDLRRMAGFRSQVSGDTKILREAIKRFTPHAHVSRILEALLPELPIQSHWALHSMLLKRQHGAEDPGLVHRLPAVFANFPFVRGPGGRWLHADTLLHVTPRPERSVVQACSYAQIVAETEEGPGLKPDANLVSILVADGNVPGMFPVAAHPASPIWHVHNPASRDGRLLVQPRDITRTALRYLRPEQRLPMAECLQIIERRWPKIDFNYFTLLRICRGLGEQGTCQLPIVWATGQTSTGKTSHAAIECALHDEVPENLVLDEKLGRPTDMLGEMQARTGVAMLDDFGKNLDGRHGQERLDNIIAFILQYGRSITYHHRHVGMLNTPVRTTLLLTDMRHPQKLVQSEQAGRRIVMVHLHTKVDWNGVEGSKNGFRNWWRETEELTRAAESWHSHVVDRYFGEGASTSIFAHAKSLGFNTLAEQFADHEVSSSKEQLVRAFVQALMLAPPAAENLQQAHGKGCVEIQPTALTPLTQAAQTLCEMLGFEGIEMWSLRQALEPYQPRLHELMPFSEPVNIDIRKHGRRVLARLVQAQRQNASPDGRQPLRVGHSLLAPGATPENMLDPTWENVPE